ncbi:MAG: glucose-6-phosphate isomerase, partial [Deltaproteobacteria bacterium]|nr:glucose-6-phosphate isomerase [Deltaproteobacteria bacterium]
MSDTSILTETPAWQALKKHYEEIRGLHLRQLFAGDPARAEKFAAKGAGLLLDYSKNRLTAQTIKLLIQLAKERSVEARRDAMFRGEKINFTEKRAVLHAALRAPKGASIVVDGENVVPRVLAVLDKMTEFADRVRRGAWLGHTGRRI